MSKLSEYSKFDQLDTDSEEEPDTVVSAPTSTTAIPSPVSSPADEELRRDDSTKRFVFCYKGERVYEWEQSLSEVTLYVPAPPVLTNTTASSSGGIATKHKQHKHSIDCQISALHLKLGLKQQPPQYFLDQPTGGTVDATESTWCLEEVGGDDNDNDNGTTKEWMIVVYLQKANKGVVWDCVLTGSNTSTSGSGTTNARLNAFDLEEVKKAVLLERYGEENPGFDFSDADVNGSVPDPRTFMGGVSYQ
jgi:hypothetical protein